jgi:hypothetical protein
MITTVAGKAKGTKLGRKNRLKTPRTVKTAKPLKAQRNSLTNLRASKKSFHRRR